MKDWVGEAAPLIQKETLRYDNENRIENENNETLKDIRKELKKLNMYMSFITGEEL